MVIVICGGKWKITRNKFQKTFGGDKEAMIYGLKFTFLHFLSSRHGKWFIPKEIDFYLCFTVFWCCKIIKTSGSAWGFPFWRHVIRKKVVNFLAAVSSAKKFFSCFNVIAELVSLKIVHMGRLNRKLCPGKQYPDGTLSCDKFPSWSRANFRFASIIHKEVKINFAWQLSTNFHIKVYLHFS